MAYELTDATGRRLQCSTRPGRVVSLIPSITESLFDLNLDSRIAGISRYCIHPADRVGSKPQVGGQKNPDFAKIDEIHPDLVILNKEENKAEHIEILAKKYPVWVTYPRQVLDTLELLDHLGGIFNVPVAVFRNEIDSAVRALSHARIGRRRALYLIWRNPWMSINRDTFIHDMMSLHGLDNVFAERHERYFSITKGDILEANPEVILLPDEPYHFLEKHKVEFDGLEVDAVRTKRLMLVDGTYFCWYGTRTARAFRYMREQVLTRCD